MVKAHSHLLSHFPSCSVDISPQATLFCVPTIQDPIKVPGLPFIPSLCCFSVFRRDLPW